MGAVETQRRVPQTIASEKQRILQQHRTFVKDGQVVF
jgi:hypothetical protein